MTVRVRSIAKSASLLLCAFLFGCPAYAQENDKPDIREESKGAEPKQGEGEVQPLISPNGIPSPSIATSLPPELGGAFGLRQALADRGFQFGINYIGEGLANLSGGVKRGATYEGRLELFLDGDLEKTFGFKGLTFHTNAFQIHGRGLSRYYIGNVLPVSNIEATPATRLFELWLDQKLFDDKVSVRFGQLAADQEFIVASNAGLFNNGTFGWPGITALNLPSSGPAYPLATPGVRVKLDPAPNVTLLGAVFNGDPAGPQGPFDDPDPQVRNRNGLNFRIRDRPFVIGEGQVKYEIGGLTGTAKLGTWAHFGRFGDNRLASDFLTIANPEGAGVPLRRRGDYGFYGVLDQQIYRLPGGDADKGVGVFLRASATPLQDRNIITAYVDGGINFNGIIPGRPNDAFGFSAAYARFSPALSQLDRDIAFYTNRASPIRTAEAVIEATYQASVVDGFNIQPIAQYIIRPAGGVADPGDPSGVRRLGNAFMVGVRSTIRY